MSGTLPTIAGALSTLLFVVSYLPMLVKAVRTKDLTSYSLGQLAIANLGNIVYSVYVFSLPFGPIWFLHSFYLVATAAMLVWHRRYSGRSAASEVPHGTQRPEVDAPAQPDPPGEHDGGLVLAVRRQTLTAAVATIERV